MYVRCPASGRGWRVSDGATIGRAADADIVIDHDSLQPHHARLAASGARPAVWYLVTCGDEDEVNGRPILGGITRLGVEKFSARLRLGKVALECEQLPHLRREVVEVNGQSRCARCAQPFLAGEGVGRCDCGAPRAHWSCSDGRCYRCGAMEEDADPHEA